MCGVEREEGKGRVLVLKKLIRKGGRLFDFMFVKKKKKEKKNKN